MWVERVAAIPFAGVTGSRLTPVFLLGIVRTGGHKHWKLGFRSMFSPYSQRGLVMPGYPQPALDLRCREIQAEATVVSGSGVGGGGWGGASGDGTAALH